MKFAIEFLLNNMYTFVIAALVGFLLPWQTRLLLHVPEIGGVKWEFGTISLYISQIVLFAWLVQEAWNARVLLRAWFKKSNPRIVVALCVLVAVQLITTSNILLTLNAFFCFALVGGLVALLKFKPQILKSFLGAFLMSVMLQVMLAFMQMLVGASFASAMLGIPARHATDYGAAVLELGGKRYLRAYGGQPHPNIFGGLMFAAAVIYAWILKTVEQMGQKKNILQFAILIVSALFLSFSRSAWGAFALFIGVLWMYRLQLSDVHRTYIKWAAGTFFVMLIIFAPFVFTRFVPETNIEHRSIDERVSELTDWKNIMKSHALFGTGVWSYTQALSAPTGDARVPVHAVPLLILAEFGIVGSALLIYIAAALWRRCRMHLVWVALLPILLFDHYLYSLWSGLVLSGILIFLFGYANLFQRKSVEVS